MSQRITKEDRLIIEKVCPKFNRICACYCNNPDYGVTLSPKAKRALNRANNSHKRNANKNVASVRLTYDEMKWIELHGKSFSEIVHEVIKEKMIDDAT